jgi:hypothetical protein
LLKRLDDIQQKKVSEDVNLKALEPRHDGKVRKYFNIGIKKTLEDNNNGVPISLSALNHNREFMINNLITPSKVHSKMDKKTKQLTRDS